MTPPAKEGLPSAVESRALQTYEYSLVAIKSHTDAHDSVFNRCGKNTLWFREDFAVPGPWLRGGAARTRRQQYMAYV